MTQTRRQPNQAALLALALALLIAVTLGHYATPAGWVTSHNVYRRLYYLPVVLGAFAWGLPGGLSAALLAGLAYIPHAFLMHHHRDPAPTPDKVMEILLYLAVGALTGALVERQRAIHRALRASLAERDALEAALVRSAKLSALGELLAGVAHEIRNPLASIMGAAEGLARRCPAGAPLVELQLREIERLRRVVSDFLAFAKPSEPSRARVEVAALFEELIRLARHRDRDAEIAVEGSLEGARVWVDRDQALQILLNLVLNALDAASPATVRLRFERLRVGDRPHARLGVEDHGPGIPEADAERVFDPYFTTKPDGSGLGLSVSSRLAEAHGGFLALERAGGRTIFWLTLPEEAS